MQPIQRLRELDFLRGIAIIFVIFRHQVLFSFLQIMGWIGVDLFFVLSGFLVSGLLFKEYQKFGKINPKLFLIRRGFKIYPIYYLTYIGYTIPKILLHKLEFKKVLFDLFFIQNYTLGWGYAYPASWSLAIEEHFYFGLALLLGFIFNKNLINFKTDKHNNCNVFERLLGFILISVLLLRIISNIWFPNEIVKNTTMTHLRIDSLLAGVLISYWFYFKRDRLNLFYFKYQKYLLILPFLLLSFTPFLNNLHSFFVKTIGFTMVYIAFGVLLIHFLLEEEINTKMNRFFTKKVVDFISKIGFCSYSIYVIHSFIIDLVGYLHIQNQYINFLLVFLISINIGFIMTYQIEKYFLTYRNKYFPSRVI